MFLLPEFKSILKKELSNFLEIRKISVTGNYTHQHDKCILSHFDNYLYSNNCCDKNITESEINKWIDSIDGKSSTKAAYITVVRSFFKQLVSLGYHPFIPVPYKVNDDYIAYMYSEDEINRIFNIADSLSFTSTKYPYLQYEIPVVLRLLYSCGLRLGEVTQLMIKDIDFDAGILLIKKAKNKKQRYVPMHDEMTTILYKYCLRLGNASHADYFVFPGVDMSNELPSYMVRNKFTILKKMAGIYNPDHKPYAREACLHCFRHKFAFESFRQGETQGWNSLDQVPWLSIYLGHNSLDETQKYLKFSFDMYPEAMDLFENYSESVFPEVHLNDGI